jgi:hypothetical protein
VRYGHDENLLRIDQINGRERETPQQVTADIFSRARHSRSSLVRHE